MESPKEFSTRQKKHFQNSTRIEMPHDETLSIRTKNVTALGGKSFLYFLQRVTILAVTVLNTRFEKMKTKDFLKEI